MKGSHFILSKYKLIIFHNWIIIPKQFFLNAFGDQGLFLKKPPLDPAKTFY
jgi:hypothetical protein